MVCNYQLKNTCYTTLQTLKKRRVTSAKEINPKGFLKGANRGSRTHRLLYSLAVCESVNKIGSEMK